MGKLSTSLKLLWRALTGWSRHVHPPLFEGMSLYDILKFFIDGLYRGSIATRASSTAFSFFLALFPFIIFLFTLIPYISIRGFQEEVFELLHDILPPNSYEAARSTIDDVVSNKRGGLLSLGFIAALIFATNGINTLMNNLSLSVHHIESKGFWVQYGASLILTVVLSVVFLAGITLLILSESVTHFFVDHGWMGEKVAEYVLYSRWLILVMLVLVGISILYYYGPAKRREWRFLSPGSLLATLLFVITSLGFSYYVENFSQYNKLYGSIGTLMIILLWIYLNALVLMLGYELNISLAVAKHNSKSVS